MGEKGCGRHFEIYGGLVRRRSERQSFLEGEGRKPSVKLQGRRGGTRFKIGTGFNED